ncbi:MAG: spore germination protein GerW family protein [Sphaerobacter sp.]|nr:spore germination protein GerW family protein [Sphaerobacter sp.]MDI3341387.1 spore germination protein GerW family protein [Sphaerobacter sp.]
MDVATMVNDLARSLIDRISGAAGTQLVFAPPYETEGRTVIPVAEVRYALGFGGGGGSGAGPNEDTMGSGAGVGGGGGVRARPVGFIQIQGERADFVPILDYTRVIVAALAAVTVLALAFARRSGRRR